MIASRKFLLAALEPFDVGFADVKAKLQQQKEVIGLQITAASERKNHKFRQQLALYCNDTRQWALSEYQRRKSKSNRPKYANSLGYCPMPPVGYDRTQGLSG